MKISLKSTNGFCSLKHVSVTCYYFDSPRRSTKKKSYDYLRKIFLVASLLYPGGTPGNSWWGVPPGSPNPDLISGPKMSFSHTRFQARPLKSIKLRKLPVFRLACVAAGPCTRLNRLHSLSALYTEGLERLRRRQFQTWSLRNYVIIA